MDYQFLKEDDSAYHLQHPDGSPFKIVKKGIGKEMMSRIESLKPQGLAQGTPNGTIADEIDQPYGASDNNYYGTNAPMPSAQPQIPSNLINDPGLPPPPVYPTSGDNISTSAAAPTQMVGPPQPTTAQQSQQPQASTNPYGQINYDQMPGFSKQSQGAHEIAGAQSQQAKDAGKAYEAYQLAIDKQATDHAIAVKKIQGEMQENYNAVMAGKIDPNRVWNNTSTAGQVGSLVGVLLSGIGSGLTGQSNMAMDVINKAIDRDIEAQKQDLGKQKTLYSMNLQKYGNEQAADAATRLHLGTVLSGQLAIGAAKSGSAEAMARANMFDGQMMEKMGMPLVHMLATAQNNQQMYQNGGIPVDQENIPQKIMYNPKYLETRVEVNGMAHQAATPKDADDARNMMSNIEPIRQGLERLEKIGPSALAYGSPQAQIANSIRADMKAKMLKLNGINRLSDEGLKLMSDQITDPTKFKELITGGKLKSTLEDTLNNTQDAALSNKLIGYKGNSQLGIHNK